LIEMMEREKESRRAQCIMGVPPAASASSSITKGWFRAHLSQLYL